MKWNKKKYPFICDETIDPIISDEIIVLKGCSIGQTSLIEEQKTFDKFVDIIIKRVSTVYNIPVDILSKPHPCMWVKQCVLPKIGCLEKQCFDKKVYTND